VLKSPAVPIRWGGGKDTTCGKEWGQRNSKTPKKKKRWVTGFGNAKPTKPDQPKQGDTFKQNKKVRAEETRQKTDTLRGKGQKKKIRVAAEAKGMFGGMVAGRQITGNQREGTLLCE